MGRYCADCDDWCERHEFSMNQWRKGDGYSRCSGCTGGNYTYKCPTCNRDFLNQNELNMHMQTHRPRNVACPVCGEQRFRNGANAVQHVESGYCTGCRGQDNARKQIYQFASQNQPMHQFMTKVPLLTNGYTAHQAVPDFPYCCPQCSKSFRQLSQLLQHQDNKHKQNFQMLTHY